MPASSAHLIARRWLFPPSRQRQRAVGEAQGAVEGGAAAEGFVLVMAKGAAAAGLEADWAVGWAVVKRSKTTIHRGRQYWRSVGSAMAVRMVVAVRAMQERKTAAVAVVVAVVMVMAVKEADAKRKVAARVDEQGAVAAAVRAVVVTMSTWPGEQWWAAS